MEEQKAYRLRAAAPERPRSPAVLTPEDVRLARHRVSVRVSQALAAEDVRHRLDAPAVGQPVGLAAEDVGLRADRPVAGADVLAVEDVRLRRRPLPSGALRVEAPEDVRPRGRAASRALAVLAAEDVRTTGDLARGRQRESQDPEEPHGNQRSRHFASYNSLAARRSRATRSRSAAGRSTFTCGPKPSTQFVSSSIPRTRILSSVVPSFRGWKRSPRLSRRARSNAAVSGSISSSSTRISSPSMMPKTPRWCRVGE